MPKIHNWSREEQTSRGVKAKWRHDIGADTVTIEKTRNGYEVQHADAEPDGSRLNELEIIDTLPTFNAARTRAVDWMKKNPMDHLEDHPQLQSTESDIPSGVKVTFTIGNPVRASKYYGRDGWTEAEEDDYVIGTKTENGIRHTGDVKSAYGSEGYSLFIYSSEGKPLSHEELEKAVEPAKPVIDGKLHRIRVYRGGRMRPALYTSASNSPTIHEGSLKLIVERLNLALQTDGVLEPQLRPEDAEEMGTLITFTR